MVWGESFKEYDYYSFLSEHDQLITIASVSEKSLDDHDLLIIGEDNYIIAYFNTSHFINSNQLRLPQHKTNCRCKLLFQQIPTEKKLKFYIYQLASLNFYKNKYLPGTRKFNLPNVLNMLQR